MKRTMLLKNLKFWIQIWK